MNQSNSSTIPRRKVRLVVRRGRVESESENRSDGGAKMDSVPVPVRSGRVSPVSRTLRMRFKYWYSSCTGFVVVFAIVGIGIALLLV